MGCTNPGFHRQADYKSHNAKSLCSSQSSAQALAPKRAYTVIGRCGYKVEVLIRCLSSVAISCSVLVRHRKDLQYMPPGAN
jgi:hypothetical protein